MISEIEKLVYEYAESRVLTEKACEVKNIRKNAENSVRIMTEIKSKLKEIECKANAVR